MITKLTRRSVLSTIAEASMLAGTTATTVSAEQMTFTLATAGSETEKESRRRWVLFTLQSESTRWFHVLWSWSR